MPGTAARAVLRRSLYCHCTVRRCFALQFLLRQVDPHIKAFGKIEDDVPTLFKQLKYPFQISKSALFAVGSPHTWPSLLAALGWLVELLNYSEKAEQVDIACLTSPMMCLRQRLAPLALMKLVQPIRALKVVA